MNGGTKASPARLSRRGAAAACVDERAIGPDTRLLHELKLLVMMSRSCSSRSGAASGLIGARLRSTAYLEGEARLFSLVEAARLLAGRSNKRPLTVGALIEAAERGSWTDRAATDPQLLRQGSPCHPEPFATCTMLGTVAFARPLQPCKEDRTSCYTTLRRGGH